MESIYRRRRRRGLKTVYNSPHDSKDFLIALLFILKPIIRRRDIKEIQNANTISKTYDNGLNRSEEHLLRRRLFGSDREAVASGAMNRLFRSTMELGYPQPGEPASTIRVILFFLSNGCTYFLESVALDRSMREARERGTDIERCCDGLPTNLRMPAPISRPDANDMLLAELPTGLLVDGGDPPLVTTANNTSTSHGDLSQLDGVEDEEVSLTLEDMLGQEAELPDPSQEPPDASPPSSHSPPPPTTTTASTQHTSAERETSPSHHRPSGSECLNYFQTLEGVPDGPVVGDAAPSRGSSPIMIHRPGP